MQVTGSPYPFRELLGKGISSSQGGGEASSTEPFYFLSLPRPSCLCPTPNPSLGPHLVLTQPPQVGHGIFVPSVVVVVQDLQGGKAGEKTKAAAMETDDVPSPKEATFIALELSLMSFSKCTHPASHPSLSAKKWGAVPDHVSIVTVR